MAAEAPWWNFAVAGDPSWLRHRTELQFGSWRLLLLPATAKTAASLHIESASQGIDEAEARSIGNRFLALAASGEAAGAIMLLEGGTRTLAPVPLPRRDGGLTAAAHATGAAGKPRRRKSR